MSLPSRDPGRERDLLATLVDLDSLQATLPARESYTKEVLARAAEALGAGSAAFFDLRPESGDLKLRAEATPGAARLFGGGGCAGSNRVALHERASRWADLALDGGGAVPVGGGETPAGYAARVGSRSRRAYGLLVVTCRVPRVLAPEEEGFIVDLARRLGDAIEARDRDEAKARDHERELSRYKRLAAEAEIRAQEARVLLNRERAIVNALLNGPDGRPGKPVELGGGRRAHDPLSERELETLRLLQEGLTYAEVGARLFIQPESVRDTVKRVGRKLGTSGCAKTLARARELGLV
jgi:DNA-binding CsgD family transcriptional regulator